MKVSVIIPNYNHASFLQQRIESVLHQSYQNFEIIILDDCSTDNSRDIIASYSSNKKISHIVYNATNSGSTFSQWKKGIALASGEYIWIAESDDYTHPDFLQTAMRRFSLSNIALFFCRSVRVNEKGIEDGNFDTWLSKVNLDFKQDFDISGTNLVKDALIKINVIVNASGVVFRKSAIHDFFKTNFTQFKYCGDWYFWTEIIQHGMIAYSANRLNFFRFHEDTTRSKKPVLKQIDYYIEELLAQILIAKLYKLKPDYNIIIKTVDNIIDITPAKNLKYLLSGFRKKTPSLLQILVKRILQRSIKKLSRKFL